MKAETWVKLVIKLEEIEHTPFDVLVQTRNVEEKRLFCRRRRERNFHTLATTLLMLARNSNRDI